MLAIVVAAATLLACGGGAHGATVCTRYASPSGRNSWHGSAGRPFHTVKRLVDSLHAGETGCLEPGTYRQNLKFPRSGRAGAPITLMSAPGTTATIVGRMYVPKRASYIDVYSLHLNGRNRARLPSPNIDSAYDQFVGDDVTNEHTGICYELGASGGYGQARYTLIQYNRIHGCGHMPPTNHQHGIYIGNAVGARILDNQIYNNADRGIQLYWNSQGAVIAGNVINHNGEGIVISGDRGSASSNNLITNNVITNSTKFADVGSWWPSGARKGTGNVVQQNCVDGGRGTIDQSGGGFSAHDNYHVDPHYADASAANFALPTGSVCQQVLFGATGVTAALPSLPTLGL